MSRHNKADCDAGMDIRPSISADPSSAILAIADRDCITMQSMSQPGRYGLRYTAGRWQWPVSSDSSSLSSSEEEKEEDDEAEPDTSVKAKKHSHRRTRNEDQTFRASKRHPPHNPRASSTSGEGMMRPITIRRRTTTQNVALKTALEEGEDDHIASTEPSPPLSTGAYTSKEAKTRSRKGSWLSSPAPPVEHEKAHITSSAWTRDSDCSPLHHENTTTTVNIDHPHHDTVVLVLNRYRILWVLTTAALLLVTVTETAWLLSALYTQSAHCSAAADPAFWNSLPTHLTSRTSYMRYGSALHAHENGTLHLAGASAFIGAPSPALDERWAALISPRYFRLSPSEVAELETQVPAPGAGSARLEPLPAWPHEISTPGVYGGIEMMHSLHCVNSLRKALSPEYYAQLSDEAMAFMLPGEDADLHLWHCIDHLRQAVLCHGDTTPVTLRPVLSVLSDGRRALTMLGETEREHSCRDGQGIVAWSKHEADVRGAI